MAKIKERKVLSLLLLLLGLFLTILDWVEGNKLQDMKQLDRRFEFM
jgi:hypothetical protein